MPITDERDLAADSIRRIVDRVGGDVHGEVGTIQYDDGQVSLRVTEDDVVGIDTQSVYFEVEPVVTVTGSNGEFTTFRSADGLTFDVHHTRE